MDAYAHLRILISMILGLGITRILSGLSRRVQTPGRTEGMTAQTIWAVIVLLNAVHFWWWEFGLRRIPDWHFGIYAFVLAYASLHFLLATLIFPDAQSDHEGSEQFFLRRRHWFFGIFALSFVFDFFDTLLKGREHLAALGVEYPLRLLVGLGCALLAALWARNHRRLAVIGVIWLTYDLSWVIRHYDSLN